MPELAGRQRALQTDRGTSERSPTKAKLLAVLGPTATGPALDHRDDRQLPESASERSRDVQPTLGDGLRSDVPGEARGDDQIVPR